MRGRSSRGPSLIALKRLEQEIEKFGHEGAAGLRIIGYNEDIFSTTIPENYPNENLRIKEEYGPGDDRIMPTIYD
jgi:hypothetical protein